MAYSQVLTTHVIQRILFFSGESLALAFQQLLLPLNGSYSLTEQLLYYRVPPEWKSGTLNGHYLQQKLQSSPIKGQMGWTWRHRPVVPAAQET